MTVPVMGKEGGRGKGKEGRKGKSGEGKGEVTLT